MDNETKPPVYDPGRALTYAALFGVMVLTIFICSIIGWQVYMAYPVSTEFVGALTFIMGWLTSEAGGIYSNRFGSTQQSAAKDQTIQQQARTAAVSQDALLDSSLTVTKKGAPMAMAALPHDGDTTPASSGATPGSPAAPLQTNSLNVVAQEANVSELQPDPKKEP